MARRVEGQVVEMTQDCEVGSWRERAVVLDIDQEGQLMTLVFPDRRNPDDRLVVTGTDYLYLRTV